MPATMSRPQIALPQHQVSLDDICKLIERLHPDAPGVDRVVRSILPATQVATRYFVRDPEEVLSTSDIARDLPATVKALAALAERAARAALQDAALDPGEVDCLIVTSVTGYVMPGLDVTLIDALGLSPHTRRIPQAQIGCAGTAWALARAREQVALYPGAKVLLVAAESFSSGFQPADVSLDAMIFKGLGGDGAAACIVRDTREAAGPGLVIEESWDYLLPASAHYYKMHIDEAGPHFFSTRLATKAVGAVLPPLRTWLDARAWPIEWAAVHTGGPLVLNAAADGLGLDERDLRHSWASLRQIGNVTSVGLHDVIARLHDDPPTDGARGVIVAFGPGFTAAALTARYTAAH